jgi:hypothetical protein
MKIIGIKTVAIRTIVLPAGFRERMAHPRIAERAKSLERVGVLHEPIVRKSDMRLIAGRDRVASAMHAGWTEMPVKLVHCTDAEMREIEMVENAHRRHSADEQRDAMVRLLAFYTEQAQKEIWNQDPSTDAPLVRPARMLAREKLANELGVQPASLRRRELRHKAAKQAQAEKKAPNNVRAPTPTETADHGVRAIGMELDATFLAQTVRINEHLGRIEATLSTALRRLTQMRDEGLPFAAQRHTRLYEAIQAVSAEVRATKPESLCPYCKGLEGAQETCTACLGAGWINAMQAVHVPHELWLEGERAVIHVEGGLISVKAYMARHRGEAIVTPEDLFA